MGRPSFQFYPGDWRKNANLGRCSKAARGAWVDVLCVLHDSDEYGVARYPLKELANASGCAPALLRELVDKRVLKGADAGGQVEAYVYVPRHGRKDGAPVTLLPAQPGPLWFSSRMVKDEHVRQNAGASTRFGAADGDAPAAKPRASAPGTDRAELRARVLGKTGGTCYHCTTRLGEVWEIDHLLPRAKGGRHTFANLVPACVTCNQDKSDTMPDDWAALSRAPSHRQGDGPSSSPSSSSSPSGEEKSNLPVAPARPAAEPLALVPPAKPKPVPDCPHLDVLALWAEMLPALPQHDPKRWRGAKAEHLRVRWRETAEAKGWPDKETGLVYFRKLFAYIGRSAFLTGRAPPSAPNKRPFVIELEWLVTLANWDKVHEGKYHPEAAA